MEEKELSFEEKIVADNLTDKQKELATVWKIAGKYLMCKRCKGTGALPELHDEMDKLCSQLNDWKGTDLEWAIQNALDKHTIKKTQRGIFTSVLKTFVKEIESYIPSAYDGTEKDND